MAGTEGRHHFNSADDARYQIALLDWMMTPTKIIGQRLSCTQATVAEYRKSPEYAAYKLEIREEWKRLVMELPDTSRLRQSISHGFAVSVNKLVEIISGDKTANKDMIAAARLLAQLDGRFLGRGVEEGDENPAHNDSVATELLRVINRSKAVQ